MSFPLAQTIFTIHIHGFAGFSRSVLVAISLSPTVVLSTSLFPSLHPKATKYKNEKKTVCLWVKRFFIDFSSVFSMFSSQTFKYQTISYSFGTKKCWCFSHINEYAWCLYVWSLHELFFFCGLAITWELLEIFITLFHHFDNLISNFWQKYTMPYSEGTQMQLFTDENCGCYLLNQNKFRIPVLNSNWISFKEKAKILRRRKWIVTNENNWKWQIT